MQSTKIIKILEGIDRIGKSTSIEWLRKHYEDQGLSVVMVHNKIPESPEQRTYDEFDSLRKTIDDFHEKEIFAYDSYAYFLQKAFEYGANVILIDRLHLTTKTYADVNRPGNIEKVFGNLTNYRNYITVFENQLNRIADVELLCFVKDANSKFEDDFLDPKWLNSAEQLKKVNNKFISNFGLTNLKKKLFICSATEQTDGTLFYNTLEQLKQHLKDE